MIFVSMRKPRTALNASQCPDTILVKLAPLSWDGRDGRQHRPLGRRAVLL